MNRGREGEAGTYSRATMYDSKSMSSEGAESSPKDTRTDDAHDNVSYIYRTTYA